MCGPNLHYAHCLLRIPDIPKTNCRRGRTCQRLSEHSSVLCCICSTKSRGRSQFETRAEFKFPVTALWRGKIHSVRSVNFFVFVKETRYNLRMRRRWRWIIKWQRYAFSTTMINLRLYVRWSSRRKRSAHICVDGSYEVRIRACVTLIDVGPKSILHARKDHSWRLGEDVNTRYQEV